MCRIRSADPITVGQQLILFGGSFYVSAFQEELRPCALNLGKQANARFQLGRCLNAHRRFVSNPGQKQHGLHDRLQDASGQIRVIRKAFLIFVFSPCPRDSLSYALSTMRPSVVLVLILASSLPSCAQQAQGKAAGPLLSLVLKQPIAAGSAVNVVWSPDEQYVLLKTNSSVGTKDSSRSTVTLSVFSVESGIEVLHLTLARAVLGSFAFAHHSKNLFVASQSGLFACALDHLVQCMTLETDLFMTPAGAFFALTPQDQLFYVSTQSERVLVTLGKSAVASKAILGAGERPDLDALQNPGIADAPEFFGVPPWGGAYIANIWQSPSGKMSMITRNDQDGTLSLWLSRPGAAGQAHAAFLLGGTRAPLRRVEINTLRQSVITRDTGFKEWSFSTGKVVTFPYNVEFAASGEVGYFTPATASGDVQQLMLQAAGSAEGKASGVQLPAVPEWFGLSNGRCDCHSRRSQGPLDFQKWQSDQPPLRQHAGAF